MANMPKVDLKPLRAKMVTHTRSVRAFADKNMAKTTGLIDKLEQKTSPMTVLWLGIGLFLFSLVGLLRAGRRKKVKVKYFYD